MPELTPELLPAPRPLGKEQPLPRSEAPAAPVIIPPEQPREPAKQAAPVELKLQEDQPTANPLEPRNEIKVDRPE